MSSKSLPENDPAVNSPNQLSQHPISQHSNQRSKFKLIPMSDDSLFAPDCDLLSIRQDQDTKLYSLDSSTEETQYVTGEKSLSIRKFPAVAYRNLQRIQSRLSKKAGLHPLVSVSIAYGLTKIAANEWIEQLVQLYNRHMAAPKNIPGFVNENIWAYLSKFEVDTPNGSKLVPKIHERTDGRLTNLSMNTGVSKVSLASLAVCITVMDQVDTIDDDVREMSRYVEKFYELAWGRGTAAKALMDAFDVPELENGREGKKGKQKGCKRDD